MRFLHVFSSQHCARTIVASETRTQRSKPGLFDSGSFFFAGNYGWALSTQGQRAASPTGASSQSGNGPTLLCCRRRFRRVGREMHERSSGAEGALFSQRVGDETANQSYPPLPRCAPLSSSLPYVVKTRAASAPATRAVLSSNPDWE
jgi:hypothetical protein